MLKTLAFIYTGLRSQFETEITCKFDNLRVIKHALEYLPNLCSQYGGIISVLYNSSSLDGTFLHNHEKMSVQTKMFSISLENSHFHSLTLTTSPETTSKLIINNKRTSN